MTDSNDDFMDVLDGPAMDGRPITEVMEDLDQQLLSDRMRLDLGYSPTDVDPYYHGAARSAVQDELELIKDASILTTLGWLRSKLEVLLAVRHYDADHEPED